MRGPDVRSPVPHGFIDRILKSLRTYRYLVHLRAEELHPEYIQRLSLNVDRAHIYLAFKAEKGGARGRCNAVLPCTRLCYDSFLAHLLCEQGLTDCVVDLVRTGMGEVLSLQINLRSAEMICQPLREV